MDSDNLSPLNSTRDATAPLSFGETQRPRQPCSPPPRSATHTLLTDLTELDASMAQDTTSPRPFSATTRGVAPGRQLAEAQATVWRLLSENALAINFVSASDAGIIAAIALLAPCAAVCVPTGTQTASIDPEIVVNRMRELIRAVPPDEGAEFVWCCYATLEQIMCEPEWRDYRRLLHSVGSTTFSHAHAATLTTVRAIETAIQEEATVALATQLHLALAHHDRDAILMVLSIPGCWSTIPEQARPTARAVLAWQSGERGPFLSGLQGSPGWRAAERSALIERIVFETDLDTRTAVRDGIGELLARALVAQGDALHHAATTDTAESVANLGALLAGLPAQAIATSAAHAPDLLDGLSPRCAAEVATMIAAGLACDLSLEQMAQAWLAPDDIAARVAQAFTHGDTDALQRVANLCAVLPCQNLTPAALLPSSPAWLYDAVECDAAAAQAFVHAYLNTLFTLFYQSPAAYEALKLYAAQHGMGELSVEAFVQGWLPPALATVPSIASRLALLRTAALAE